MSDEAKQIVVQEKPGFWSDLLKRHGIGAVALVAIYFQIILPMFNKQTQFIDSVEKSVVKMSETAIEQKMINVQVESSLRGIDEGIKRLNAMDATKIGELHEISETSKDNGEKLDAIHKKINGGG